MNGFINLNKPTGRTSSDLVVFVRKRLPRGTAVGHGGTLDPEASGVLPVCVGSATRLFDYIIDKQKTYVARIRLGVETDTQDATGQVVSERPVTVGEAELRAVLPEFTGEIEQKILEITDINERKGKLSINTEDNTEKTFVRTDLWGIH